MWLFVSAHPSFWWFGFFALLMTVYLGISYFIGFLGRDLDFDKHQKLIKDFDRSCSIDVFLPCAGEPIELLRNTYKFVSKLKWYGKVSIYVLDDAGRAEVKTAARDAGFQYISRPDKGVLKKAGNLRHAFRLTQGEFILILDADFCPRSDFLQETVPYFYQDKSIAIVQTPQYFTLSNNQTWVEKGAAYIQELFYRLIQVNRDRFDGAICVGTCAVYRREALAPFGGTAAIGYSEDVHTGFNVMLNNWKVRYLPINLAKGICPDAMPQFFTQQYRWAMGSITLFLNKEFWLSPLTRMQKICFLSGMLYYIATALGLFLTIVPSLVLVLFAPEYVLWYNAFFSIPSFIFGLIFMAVWTTAPFGWYAPRARMITYYAHLFALVDKLRGDLMPWTPTGEKSQPVGRFYAFRSLMFYWVSLSTILVVGASIYHSSHYPWYNFIPAVFFAAYNYWISFTVLRDQD
jgi:cellulose synthase/poly-beta-1,6-N-acetylglucosamine synthase-like glycosyltransferase